MSDANDPRLDPRLDPAKTAVVLIDLQNDIIRNQEGPFYSSIHDQVKERKVVENVVRLTEGARAAGATIFYITVVRRKDYEDVVNQLTELVAAGKGVPAKKQVSLIEGTRGAQLVDELKPQPQDYVLVKKRRNAFHQTELDFHLRARGITTIVIGGVATDLGVENTVRDAWDRDYNVVVVEDISVAVPPAAHDNAIKSIFPRMARIMSTDQVLAELRKDA
ncbi:MAG: cysteine hydrolase family protein [Rhizobiaceae bacterium]